MLDLRTNGVGGQVSREIGTLFDSEIWWRDHFHEIKSHGYILRPRYRPDWVPSWKNSGKDFFTVEDGQPTLVGIVRPFSCPPCLNVR